MSSPRTSGSRRFPAHGCRIWTSVPLRVRRVSRPYESAAVRSSMRHSRWRSLPPVRCWSRCASWNPEALSRRGNMALSRNARLMSGITLLIVPTIMYGGWTLLGILTLGGVGGAPGALRLDPTQWALWRAGHAHAGVWTLLSVVLQV